MAWFQTSSGLKLEKKCNENACNCGCTIISHRLKINIFGKMLIFSIWGSGSFGVRGETNMWRSYQMFCLESVTNQRNLFTLKVNRVLWLVIESWRFQINNKSLSPIIYAFSQIWQKIRLVAPSYISLPFHPRRATGLKIS